jgi:hypothetical protein
MNQKEILEAYQHAVENVVAEATHSINTLLEEKIESASLIQREADTARLEELRRKLQS